MVSATNAFVGQRVHVGRNALRFHKGVLTCPPLSVVDQPFARETPMVTSRWWNTETCDIFERTAFKNRVSVVKGGGDVCVLFLFIRPLLHGDSVFRRVLLIM